MSTLAETLIIPDITKTEFNYCFIIQCFMENIQKLLCEMLIDFICASKNRRKNRSEKIARLLNYHIKAIDHKFLWVIG